VELTLDDVEDGRTRMVVVELPLVALRVAAEQSIGALGAARGPQMAFGLMDATDRDPGPVFAALADPTRREVVRLLAAHPGLTASAGPASCRSPQAIASISPVA